MLYQKLLFTLVAFSMFVTNAQANQCQGATMQNGFCWPTENNELLLSWHEFNDKFPGKFHLAQDIRATEGDAIYAIADVVEVLHSRMNVGCYGGFNNNDTCIDGGGLIIKYQLSNGQYFTALYGHVKNISVNSNVKKGQKIAEVGPYRNGTVHIHFGIRFPFNDNSDRWAGYGMSNLGFIDPINFLKTHAPYLNLSDDSSPTEFNVKAVDNYAWYPPNVDCFDAVYWFEILPDRCVQRTRDICFELQGTCPAIQ